MSTQIDINSPECIAFLTSEGRSAINEIQRMLGTIRVCLMTLTDPSAPESVVTAFELLVISKSDARHTLSETIERLSKSI